MRVEIPAYADRWMMGDHYGNVVKQVQPRKGAACQLDRYLVLLDKSNKVVRVIADDCKEI